MNYGTSTILILYRSRVKFLNHLTKTGKKKIYTKRLQRGLKTNPEPFQSKKLLESSINNKTNIATEEGHVTAYLNKEKVLKK